MLLPRFVGCGRTKASDRAPGAANLARPGRARTSRKSFQGPSGPVRDLRGRTPALLGRFGVVSGALCGALRAVRGGPGGGGHPVIASAGSVPVRSMACDGKGRFELGCGSVRTVGRLADSGALTAKRAGALISRPQSACASPHRPTPQHRDTQTSQMMSPGHRDPDSAGHSRRPGPARIGSPERLANDSDLPAGRACSGIWIAGLESSQAGSPVH